MDGRVPGLGFGGKYTHNDMQMNVTILNEIIVLNEGRTEAVPNPILDSEPEPAVRWL